MTRLLLILAAFVAGALFTYVVASGMGGGRPATFVEPYAAEPDFV